MERKKTETNQPLTTCKRANDRLRKGRLACAETHENGIVAGGVGLEVAATDNRNTVDGDTRVNDSGSHTLTNGDILLVALGGVFAWTIDDNIDEK